MIVTTPCSTTHGADCSGNKKKCALGNARDSANYFYRRLLFSKRAQNALKKVPISGKALENWKSSGEALENQIFNQSKDGAGH